jgi:hypothetical protein
MLLAVLSRTLKQILSQGSNCEKKKDGETRETNRGKKKESRESNQSAKVDAKHFRETIPDPWFK